MRLFLFSFSIFQGLVFSAHPRSQSTTSNHVQFLLIQLWCRAQFYESKNFLIPPQKFFLFLTFHCATRDDRRRLIWRKKQLLSRCPFMVTTTSTGYLVFWGAAAVVLSDFFFQHLVHVTENVAEPLGERKKKKRKDLHRPHRLWEGKGTVASAWLAHVTWNVALAPHPFLSAPIRTHPILSRRQCRLLVAPTSVHEHVSPTHPLCVCVCNVSRAALPRLKRNTPSPIRLASFPSGQ